MSQFSLEPCTTFEFIWLAGDSIPNHSWPTGKPSHSAETARRPPTVLIVDDEKLIVDTMVEILNGAGLEAIGAYDGWTALEHIAQRQPDYVLADVLMPQMNGVELAIAIRKMHSAVRVVLFSGQAGISEILLAGQRQGFEFEVIAKPIHPLKLIERFQVS
jgi:CheY-like chemotaxis protein